MPLVDGHLTTLLAVANSDNLIWESSKVMDDWNATIAETRELIAHSRDLLAKPLPVGAAPLFAD
jgi:hypothetical protein